MGKNYSRNNTGKRKTSDFYETLYSMTGQYLSKLNMVARDVSILEPACGNGAITRVLKSFGFTNITEYDLKDGKNFLTETQKFDWIITNPPYKQSTKFVLHAKKIAKTGFAMLLPLPYLHGQERYKKIFTDKEYPLCNVSVFTRYPLLGEPIREDGKYNTGMQAYAWFTWYREPRIKITVIDWINNDEYVLRKNS